MLDFYSISQDIYVLSSSYHIPRFGTIPVNSYVLLSEEPVLIDAGLGRDSEDFVNALKAIIDPQELKWLWLTHDDVDHAGNIKPLLEFAPKAKLAVHALSALRMNTSWQVPLERVYALSIGEKISVGDRKLTLIKPPLYDSPYTVGLFDEKSGALFSVDAFGAVLKRKERNTASFSDQELDEGMTAWASFDTPWVHLMEEQKFKAALDEVRELNPSMILSSHLPTARTRIEQLVDVLSRVPQSKPFVMPDQTVFSRIIEESNEIITY